MTNDSALVLPVVANAVYDVKVLVNYTGAAFGTGDLKVFFTLPAGAGYILQNIAYNAGGSTPGNDVSRLSENTGFTFINSSEGATARWSTWLGTVTTSSTAGNFQLQAAQNTASGTDTIIGTNSTMTLQRIG